MRDLIEMQEAQRKWATENFGAQTPIQMMVGLIGELGEFAEHYELRDDAEIVDAIGDVGVYLMNYCNLKGWMIRDLVQNMVPADDRARYYPYNILPFVKSLPHHQLKGDQNIRGGTAYHDECMKKVLSNLLWQLDQVAMQTKHTFVECLAITWSKVSRRDWILHPDNADVVAEQKPLTPFGQQMMEVQDTLTMAALDAAAEESDV